MNFNIYLVEDMRGLITSISYCVSIRAETEDHLVRSILSYLNNSGHYKVFRRILSYGAPALVDAFIAIRGNKDAIAEFIRGISVANVAALYNSLVLGSDADDSPLLLVSDGDCMAPALQRLTEKHNREYHYYVAADL
jgi:hypothetical protein